MSIRSTVTLAQVGHASLACLAGFVLAILSTSLAEADYGRKAVIGASYQQTSTTTSTDGINEGFCNGSGVCYILFQRAPEQKRLIVRHVSCRVLVTAGGLRYGYLRTRKGQIFPLRFTYLTPVNPTDSTWIVNSPVMHLVESKEYPIVVLGNNAVTNWGAECNISGQLIQP